MDRNQIIHHMINRAGKGMEIGPLCHAVAPKSLGFDVTIVDHLDQAGLKKKYQNDPNVALERIEAVDVVWAGGPLSEHFKSHEKFDYIVASHVIEHIPDVISFINDVSKLLTEDGILALVVPDKRYCFDFFKPLTSSPAMIQAFLEKRKIHTAATALEHKFYSTANRGQIAWSRAQAGDVNTVKILETVPEAYQWTQAYLVRPVQDYVDFHAWYFTPSSFELCFLELALLELIDLKIEHQHPTQGYEFYVGLKRGKLPINAAEARATLLWKTQYELHDSISDYLGQESVQFALPVRPPFSLMRAKLLSTAKQLLPLSVRDSLRDAPVVQSLRTWLKRS